MKKSIKNLETKAIKAVSTVKGGEDGNGTGTSGYFLNYDNKVGEFFKR